MFLSAIIIADGNRNPKKQPKGRNTGDVEK